MTKLRTHFTFRVDTWTPDGESIVEHVAGVEDYQIALATFRAACQRWHSHHLAAGRPSYRGQPAPAGGVSKTASSFWSNRSSFLIGELLLGKLSETVVVHGNAPHDRPGVLVGHLIGNRASFLCTKAPMLRVPNKLSGHSQDLLVGEMLRRFSLPPSPRAEKATAFRMKIALNYPWR